MPRWLPAVLYGALALVLFREFAFSDGMLFGTDTAALGYFARKFYADFVRATHEFPFWNPRIFGGLPFVDAMHGDIFYPTTLLSFVMPLHRALGWKLVVHVVLAGLFTYLWLRRIGVSPWATLWGGAAYLLAPVLVSLVYPGHDGKLFVTALTPLLFWATDRAVSGVRAADYGVLALVLALLVFTAHMQLAYFALWGALGWALFRLFGWRGPAALLPALVLFALLRSAVGGLAAAALFALLGAGALAALAVRRPAWRSPLIRFALFAGAGVLGTAVAAVQLLGPACYLGGAPRALCGETFAYSQRVGKTTEAETERGYAYSASWSLHPEEAAALVVPEFVGVNLGHTAKGSVETYWGRNPFKLNHEYAGVIGLLLAPLLFLRRRTDVAKGAGGARSSKAAAAAGGSTGAAGLGRTTLAAFFVGLAAVTLLYALGATTPAFRLFYWLVPGVQLFRAPSSIMFLFALATTTLGALAIDEVRERAGDEAFVRRLKNYLLGLVGALGALAILGSLGRLLPDLWLAILYRDLSPDKGQALAANLGNIQRGLWLTLGLAVAVSGLVWAGARGRIRTVGLVAGLLLLAILDEWRVGARFIQTVSPEALFPADETIQYLQEEAARRPPFRVFSVTRDDNLPALYGLEMVAGHHGNEIGRYRALLETGPGDVRLLQFLNTAYVLSHGEVRGPSLSPVGRGRLNVLYRLEGAFPRAFLVGRIEVVSDSLALDRFAAPDFDPGRTALLPEPPPADVELDPDVHGEVRWISREVNRQALEVEASGPGLLVVTENYYPAWRVRVDGRPAPLLRVNLAFRGVPVPAGRHQVEFVFRSDLFRRSLGLSAIAGALAIGLLLGPWLRLPRRRPGGGETG